jgi:hypothetical protein
MKDISWKNRWKSIEMDQFAREEKRSIKKRNHKNNRKNAKYFLKNNDYDSALEWIDLNEKSK